MREDRIVAPEWFGRVRYDVTTTVPAGRDDLRAVLLKQAAANTFMLETHRERRPAQVYVLTVAGRARLKPATAQTSRGFTPQPGAFTGVSTTVGRLMQVLSRNVGNVEVLDETRLTGTYDFDLTWRAGDVESLHLLCGRS